MKQIIFIFMIASVRILNAYVDSDMDGVEDIFDKESKDVVSVFDFLRDGSYAHYWAFDKGLKNLGINNGCCDAGDFYCKTVEEYPTQSDKKKDKKQ